MHLTDPKIGYQPHAYIYPHPFIYPLKIGFGQSIGHGRVFALAPNQCILRSENQRNQCELFGFPIRYTSLMTIPKLVLFSRPRVRNMMAAISSIILFGENTRVDGRILFIVHHIDINWGIVLGPQRKFILYMRAPPQLIWRHENRQFGSMRQAAFQIAL